MEPWQTPEEAALAGFDPRYAKVIKVTYLRSGRFAEVELATNEEPFVYPYWVMCERVEGGWINRADSNGPYDLDELGW